MSSRGEATPLAAAAGPTSSSLARVGRWCWPVCGLAAVGLGVALKGWSQPYYLFTAGYDDGLMVQMADGFLHGQWSTSWAASGPLTLAKPVGFPLMLAGLHFVALPTRVSLYLVCAAGALLAAWGWWRLSGSRAQAAAVAAVLALDPVHFAEVSQRIYRDPAVDAIATLVIGLCFVAAAGIGRGRRRRVGSVVALAAAGCGIGLVAITKPTWYFLVPAAAAPLVFEAAGALKRSGSRVRTAAWLLVVTCLAASCAFGVVEATIVANERAYGVGLVEDFASGGLGSAWKAWASVEAGPTERFVPITGAMRAAVYDVSPAARRLRPYLESPEDRWHQMYCHGRPGCSGSGKFFEWDLRTAAVVTGQADSPASFERYFSTLANEIETACATGRLRCNASPVLATGLPPLDAIPVTTVARETAVGVARMVVPVYVIGAPPVRVPGVKSYDRWAAVVRGLPPRAELGAPPAPSGAYGLARAVEIVFSGVNLLCLCVCAAGAGTGLWRRARRPSRETAGRRRARLDRRSTAVAITFLVATLVGMGTLAVFNVGQSPTYVRPLYWSDFAAPAELAVVFAAFAAWPLLAGPKAAAGAEKDPT